MYPHAPTTRAKVHCKRKEKKVVLVNYNNMKIKFPSICYDLYYNSQIPKCICTKEQAKK